jgi:hypothetical protein
MEEKGNNAAGVPRERVTGQGGRKGGRKGGTEGGRKGGRLVERMIGCNNQEMKN